MTTPPVAPVEAVRAANDRLRSSFTDGKVVYSEWVQSFDDRFRAEITKAVMEAVPVPSENDPEAVHCFGTFTVRDWWLLWKIDTFALDGTLLGDLADPATSNRVLTIKAVFEP